MTKEEQYLKKIADSITDLTENPLPEVSSEDEGKVPVVGSDGKWELGEGGRGSSDSFVVFDGDIVFEEYDDDGDIYGKTINPPEILAIANGTLKAIAKCPLVYDSLEVDGISIPHYRSGTSRGNSWYYKNEDGDVWFDISKDEEEIDGEYVTCLVFESYLPGTYHIKITASYGGTTYIGSDYGSVSATLYMDSDDVITAYRRLRKVILAQNGSTGRIWAPLDFSEGEDIEEDDFYFISVGGLLFYAPPGKFFRADLHHYEFSANFTIWYDDYYPEWVSTFKPDVFIAALNSQLRINVFYIINSATESSFIRLNYTIYLIDDIPAVELWGHKADNTTISIKGLTTNSTYTQSNV